MSLSPSLDSGVLHSVVHRAKPHVWMLIPTIVIARIAYGWRNIQLDDAMIYLRYTRNFRQGNGLVYNPGERFNGLTSPLFSYVMAGGSFVTTNWQLLMIGISTAAFVAAAIIFGTVFGRNRWESTFIATALGSCSYFYSTFGMETTMFLLMIAVTLYACRIRSDYAVVAAAVLVGTRPEGVFLAAPVVLDFLWHHRRLPRIAPTSLAAGIFALPFVVNLTYYGQLLPATSGAKIGQGQSGFWGADDAFLRMDYLRTAFFAGSKTTVFLLVALALTGAVTCRRDHVARVSAAFALSLFYFYWMLNLPNYGWYYAPFVALTVVFACKGLWHLATIAIDHLRLETRGQRVLILALPAAAAIFIGTNVVTLAGWGHHSAYEAVGVWLRENTPPDSSVGTLEIGNIGWYSERPVVDVLGLVNEENADFIAEQDVYGWLTVYQPDVIVRLVPVTPWESGIAVLEDAGAYEVDESFPFRSEPLQQRGDISGPYAANNRFPFGLQLLRKTGAVSDAEIATIMNDVRTANGFD